MFSIYLALPAALGPGGYSLTNSNEYEKKKNNVLAKTERSVLRADNITSICEPTV
jgi:hypothetical protein